jgi:hypothetical protein
MNRVQVLRPPVTYHFRYFQPVSFKQNTCPNGQVFDLAHHKIQRMFFFAAKTSASKPV